MGVGYNPKIITNGLILALDAGNIKSYPGSGTSWTDLSGNGYVGTLVNSPTYSSTENGGTFTFNGTNNYVNLGNNFNFTTQDFSIGFWIYLNSYTTSTVNQGPIPFYKGGFQGNGYYSAIGLTGQFSLVTNQAGAAQATSTNGNAVPLTTWTNIQITRTGASVSLYINGSYNVLTAGTHINPTSSSDNFFINSYSGPSIISNAKYSFFSIYNRALTSQEIKQNFNATRGRYGR